MGKEERTGETSWYQEKIDAIRWELGIIRPGEECEDPLSYVQAMGYVEDLHAAYQQGLLSPEIVAEFQNVCRWMRENRELIVAYFGPVRSSSLDDLVPYPQNIINDVLTLEPELE